MVSIYLVSTGNAGSFHEVGTGTFMLGCATVIFPLIYIVSAVVSGNDDIFIMVFRSDFAFIADLAVFCGGRRLYIFVFCSLMDIL